MITTLTNTCDSKPTGMLSAFEVENLNTTGSALFLDLKVVSVQK